MLVDRTIDERDDLIRDAELRKLDAIDPSRLGGVVTGPKGCILVARDGDVFVDSIRIAFAIQGYDPQLPDDAHAQSGLFRELALDGRLEILAVMDPSAGQRPRTKAGRPSASDEKDTPGAVEHHRAYSQSRNPIFHGDRRERGRTRGSIVPRDCAAAGRVARAFVLDVVTAMVGMSLVRPLEDDWRDTLDAIARKRRWPTSRDVERLAGCVVALSRAYNDPARARASVSEAGAARLAFSFVRDVPKGAAAVRELLVTGAVPALDARTTLRVLDVGAGLGAMTWGILRALRAAGATHRLDATWLDDDAAALEIGTEIVRERRADLRLRSLSRSLGELRDCDVGRFDLVVVGNVLSEVGVALPDEPRILQHIEIVRTMMHEHVEERGAVIVIEPALRDRTRRLHRVRDGLMKHGISVFAPCLHSSSCPALARDSDWCHEDLPVDLPQWLEPVARAAGLRRQGLTFSYLVLTKGASRLADALGAARAPRLRVVSDRQATKGKCEAFLCGEFRSDGGVPAVARARVMRLDRDRTAANEDWGELGRGDVVEVNPAPALERPRIDRMTEVRRIEAVGVRGRVESR